MFIERARVYDVPVPVDAFVELTAGLTISLDRHVSALANLGLLEIGSEGGGAVYRVSPLVKPAFDAADGPRWHGVAADYWWQAARQEDGWSMSGVLQAWEHALAARRQDIADPAADLLNLWLERRGAFARSAALAARHVAAFPDSGAGLNWAGYARFRAGDPRGGRPVLERAVELASASPENADRATGNLALVLASLGEYAAAGRYFAALIAAEEDHHPEGSVQLASYLHSLARVQHAQGDLAGARARLERTLAILQKVYGSEDHPDVAAALHALGHLLYAQGDLAGARARLERALAILQEVHGPEDHPDISATLHELAVVLRAQGDLGSACARLEWALVIWQKVHGPSARDTLRRLETAIFPC